jgi:hypothetical protein
MSYKKIELLQRLILEFALKILLGITSIPWLEKKFLSLIYTFTLLFGRNVLVGKHLKTIKKKSRILLK